MRTNLKLLRVSRNLTQEEMASLIGVSRYSYSKIENGKSQGSTSFWLKLKKQFPHINIEDVAEIKERAEV